MTIRDLLPSAGSSEIPINTVSSNNVDYAFTGGSVGALTQMYLPENSSVSTAGISYLIVGVGENSRTMFSTNGMSWNSTNNLYSAANGFKNFIGCIWNGSYYIAWASDDPVIYRSNDGVSWTAAGNTGLPYGVDVVAGNNTKMFAMNAGYCAYSTDNGSSWTMNSNLQNNTTFQNHGYSNFSLQYGHSFSTPMLTLVYTDYNITDGIDWGVRMWSSPDGITWTARTPPLTYGYINGIAYGGTSQNRMVMYGRRSNGTSTTNAYVAYSTNGTSWTAATASEADSVEFRACFDFYNNRFSGHSSGANLSTFIDTDGVGTWTNLGSLGAYIRSWTYNNQYPFVWVFANGSNAGYSSNGTTVASAQMNNVSTPCRGVSSTKKMLKLNSGKILTFGGTIMSSTNYGTSWSLVSGTALCAAYNHNSGLIVAGSFNGYIYTSTDGVTWTEQTGLRTTAWGTNRDVLDIEFNGSVFCAVGEYGQCATSTDGVTWTYQSGLSSVYGSSAGFRSITWNGSVFCTVGGAGYVATSPDGSSWTSRGQPNLTPTLYAVSSDKITGTIIFGGSSGIFTSVDNGANWTKYIGLISGLPQAITHDGKKFIIVDANGRIHTTPDGINLTRITPAISLINADTITSVLFTGSNYLFGGQKGSMYKSS